MIHNNDDLYVKLGAKVDNYFILTKEEFNIYYFSTKVLVLYKYLTYIYLTKLQTYEIELYSS